MHGHVLLSVGVWSCSDLSRFVHLLSPRNKHIMIDLGTGNNNKMCVFSVPASRRVYRISRNWAMDNKQEVSEHPRLPRSSIHLFLSLAYRHHRDGIPWGLERTWSRRLAQGSVSVHSLALVLLTRSDRLFDSLQVLTCTHHSRCSPCHVYTLVD